MGRDPKDAPLLSAKFEPSTTATVEMPEIDGMDRGVILRFTDVGRSGEPYGDKELRTCYGDLYAVVNALRDYAYLLESVIPEWGLTGFHAASYEVHATQCRKIAGKYAAAIGYDYDKAMERCRKRRARDSPDDGTGLDGLEALVRKHRKPDAGNQRKEDGMKSEKQKQPPQQYGLTAEGLRQLRDAADPGRPHTYEWYVIENINTPEKRMDHVSSLEIAIRTYAALDCADKRLGVTKDGIAAVDIIIRHGGREWVSEDRLKLDSFKSDPTIAAAVAEIQRALDNQTPTQGTATDRKEDY